MFNSVPKDKVLDYSKLKIFADDKIPVIEMVVDGMDDKCGQKCKC